MEDQDFSGAKIALICGGAVLTYRRDDKPNIPYPDQWDLAGGGREDAETPEQCAIRETNEEFGLAIEASRIFWKRRYPHALNPTEGAFFMVAEIAGAEIDAICFGNEGQYWQMMDFQEFLHHPNAVAPLRDRLGHFLAQWRDLKDE
ncbi:NUDIX hydrolase [Sulfitobacter sp. 1151]|uniref:NUDIX hydrolase n=1 Tax=Parasulfitobacter algicola TaxID=2614809 RepID=A0ABX2IWP8_9RHOB|nr:NUDIX hydrolase [Sulfitobacter algicola]